LIERRAQADAYAAGDVPDRRRHRRQQRLFELTAEAS
jgi:hypothetical protein